MRHQGLSQLILNVEKKKSEKVVFNVGVSNNTQTSRPTIYLDYPNFCLFPIRAKRVETEVMTLSAEAYLWAAEAILKF